MSLKNKLLVCAISDKMRNDSCLMFAISMLKLQGHLARMAGLSVNIAFTHDEADALKAFQTSDYDSLVVLHTMFGFDPELVMKMITSDKDFVIGIYPLPGIDFAQVKSKVQSNSTEDVKNQGLTYNCEIQGLDMKSKLARVHAIKEAKIYKVSKRVTEGVEAPTAEKILTAWAKPIYGDVEHQATSFGPHDFVGCVGMRRALR